MTGASKTTTLVEIARRAKLEDPSRSFRYLVFGNANSTEAKLKFGSNAICSTLHSLAYQAVVKPYKLKTPIRPYLTWKDIPKTVRIPFGETPAVLAIVSDFCNSSYTDLNAYLSNEEIDYPLQKPVQQILSLMFEGTMPCTHELYLKLYHIGLLNGSIIPETEDILAVDEAGDLTQITLDIFNKFPAKQKIMVGDSAQAIFHFMGCVNGFTFFRKRGITLSLTKSFRVSVPIAARIQTFCQKTFDPSLKIQGMDYVNPITSSEAYITRSNSSLVAKIVGLNKTNTPFNLVSKLKAKQLFKYPLFLLGLKANNKFTDPQLKEIQKDVDDWYSSKQLQLKTPSVFNYVIAENSDNPDIDAAANLLRIFEAHEIIAAFKATEEHKATTDGITITTAHSSKGLEYDIVTFDPDMNESIESTMLDLRIDPNYEPKEEEIAELKLYYVAASRCKHELINARWI